MTAKNDALKDPIVIGYDYGVTVPRSCSGHYRLGDRKSLETKLPGVR